MCKCLYKLETKRVSSGIVVGWVKQTTPDEVKSNIMSIDEVQPRWTSGICWKWLYGTEERNWEVHQRKSLKQGEMTHHWLCARLLWSICGNCASIWGGCRPQIWKYDIDSGESPPAWQPPWHVPFSLCLKNVKMVNEIVIQEFDSPWASPVVLVDRGVRFCVEPWMLLPGRMCSQCPASMTCLTSSVGSKSSQPLMLKLVIWYIQMEK